MIDCILNKTGQIKALIGIYLTNIILKMKIFAKPNIMGRIQCKILKH